MRLAFVIAVLIGGLIVLIAMELASIDDPSPPAPAAPSPTGAAPAPHPRAPDSGALAVADAIAQPGPTAVRAFGSQPAAPPELAGGERSPVADELNSPAGNARLDLAIVGDLFGYYLEQFRELPVGNNAEITAALAGDNPRGYAVLPADHPAINSAGELTDRWGTAYLFHQLAGDLMEVRSCGPDRRRFTDDDLLWPAREATDATLADAAP